MGPSVRQVFVWGEEEPEVSVDIALYKRYGCTNSDLTKNSMNVKNLRGVWSYQFIDGGSLVTHYLSMLIW